MSQLEFDESTARQLEVLYGTRDVRRRRHWSATPSASPPANALRRSSSMLARGFDELDFAGALKSQ